MDRNYTTDETATVFFTVAVSFVLCNGSLTLRITTNSPGKITPIKYNCPLLMDTFGLLKV